jgi:hypothetical protein
LPVSVEVGDVERDDLGPAEPTSIEEPEQGGVLGASSGPRVTRLEERDQLSLRECSSFHHSRSLTGSTEHARVIRSESMIPSLKAVLRTPFVAANILFAVADANASASRARMAEVGVVEHPPGERHLAGGSGDDRGDRPQGRPHRPPRSRRESDEVHGHWMAI